MPYAGTHEAAHRCRLGHLCNCVGVEPGHQCAGPPYSDVGAQEPVHYAVPVDPDSVPAGRSEKQPTPWAGLVTDRIGINGPWNTAGGVVNTLPAPTPPSRPAGLPPWLRK